MEKYSDKLGSPQIQLAGLQIWVRSRERPEATDYWDANWISVTVHCGAKGADVWASGTFIFLTEIKDWADSCEQMYKTLSGEANLNCMEPELSVKMRMHELGHISIEVSLTPDCLTQEHKFKFEVDQSYLPQLVNECRNVLAKYPIQGENG
jgi:hypothetical protein